MELLQEIFLTGCLSRRVLRVIARHQVGIMRRIPFRIIDPVDDPIEIFFSLVQNAFQSVAEFGSLDFLAIPLADGIDHIGIDDARLHQINSFPKFDPFRIVHLLGKTREPVLLLSEQPLISNIVDGENDSGVGENWILPVD